MGIAPPSSAREIAMKRTHYERFACCGVCRSCGRSFGCVGGVASRRAHARRAGFVGLGPPGARAPSLTGAARFLFPFLGRALSAGYSLPLAPLLGATPSEIATPPPSPRRWPGPHVRPLRGLPELRAWIVNASPVKKCECVSPFNRSFGSGGSCYSKHVGHVGHLHVSRVHWM